MIFSIGIRRTHDELLEGLYDVHVTKPMTVIELQDIIQICNKHLIHKINNGLRDEIDIIDIMRAIANVMDCTIELDVNLQYDGTNKFANGACKVALVFIRSGVKWPASVMEYNEPSTPFELYEFLFWDFPITFQIGIVTKGITKIFCNVTTMHDHLRCSKMIQLLEMELILTSPAYIDINELLEILVLFTGGTVQPNLDYYNEGKDEDDIDLIFIHGRTQCEMIYHGNVEALQAFLTAA